MPEVFECYPKHMAESLRDQDANWNPKGPRETIVDFFTLVAPTREGNRFDIIGRPRPQLAAGTVIHFVVQGTVKPCVGAVLVQHVPHRHVDADPHARGYFLLDKIEVLAAT
jgi:hypothetical protein